MMSNNQYRYFATFGKDVKDVTIGVPKEIFPNERRIALSPEASQRLIKLGFKVNVQQGAGDQADFHDSDY